MSIQPKFPPSSGKRESHTERLRSRRSAPIDAPDYSRFAVARWRYGVQWRGGRGGKVMTDRRRRATAEPPQAYNICFLGRGENRIIPVEKETTHMQETQS